MDIEGSLVAVVMGSQSDWSVMKHTCYLLDDLGVPHQSRIISAHRTPDLLFSFAGSAREQGFEIIIAGAGGAAHLPGMLAAKTSLPVLGVPIPSTCLQGIDSVLSIVQMPKGIPVATFAIGEAGAVNAALFAVSILANKYLIVAEALEEFRHDQTQKVLQQVQPSDMLTR